MGSETYNLSHVDITIASEGRIAHDFKKHINVSPSVCAFLVQKDSSNQSRMM